MGNFQPLEVVNRGSETQSQMVGNLNKFTLQEKGLKRAPIYLHQPFDLHCLKIYGML